MSAQTFKRPVKHPLSAAIAGRNQYGDDKAGVPNNSNQPVSGVPRGGGQEDGAVHPDGDDLHRGSGQLPEDEDVLVGGALAGETDYLDAHDLIDWEQAPFATTAWAIGRAAATPQNSEPAPIARWLWIGKDGKVTGTLAPTFDVVIHPGRGMTLSRPPGLEAPIARPSGILLP